MEDKAYNSLSTKTKNALRRNELKGDRWFRTSGPPITKPWNMTVKNLVWVKGIGPAAIAEIARATERYCL